MNIVVVNDSASVNGGAAKVALAEAVALANAGHSVHLLCGVGPVAPELQHLPNLHLHLLDIPDINVDPNRLRAMTLGLYNPRSYRYMTDLLHSLNPSDTIVHAHSWTRSLSSSVLKASLDANRATVITLHDYLLGCPQGTFFRQQEACNCELRPMSLRCITTNCDASGYSKKLWRVGRKLVQDQVSGVPGNISNFIYVSNSSLALLKPYLSAQAECFHVPNPIDVSPAQPAPVALSDTFYFVGRFVPEKGAVLFAKAAAAQGIASRFIGDGPQRSDIIQINPAAQMTGWLPSAQLPAALREARALVFPSVWHEVLGLTVLEAAAQGIPSIVPRGCGAEESVIDGVTGLHFTSGDADDLEAKIAILKDPEVAARFGKAAHARFWSTRDYTMSAHVKSLEAVYAQMLAKQQLFAKL